MDGNNFKFKKSLGQNFLIDKNIINNIIALCDIKNNTLIVEVGPGSGALTKELVKLNANVKCFEIDKSLSKYLDEIQNKNANLEILYEDFLKADLNKIKSNYNNLIFISNLPYYITTPIIKKVISQTNVDQMIIMVQKEVGLRFCAKNGTKDYNSLSIFLQYFFDIKSEFIVSKNCFFPQPNVDSMVVSLKAKEKMYLKNEEHFFKLVKDSFRFKRKTIKNNLKDYDLKKIENVLNKHNKSLSDRSEMLTIEEFIDISNEIN